MSRILVLAHRDELIEQAYAKIVVVLGSDIDVGIVKAERNEIHAAVIVASVQTLRGKRLDEFPTDFSLIVIDEAHHAAANTYRAILDHLGAFDPSGAGPFVLGVTATADRGDGVGLSEIFEEIAFKLPMLDLIDRGYLANLRAIQVAIDADFNTLHTRGGDIVDGESGRVLLEANAPSHVAAAYAEHAFDRKGVVFVPTIVLAHEMAKSFNEIGIPAAGLDGTTPIDKRRRILGDLHTGEIQVVANASVLTEGFDEPSIACIVISRPTKSRSLYQQMVGRGMRPYPGKEDCLIIDIVGATTRHDLLTVPELFGLPVSALKTKTVAEAISDLREEEERAAAHGRLVSATIDLFRQRPANWIPTKTGRFALPTGSGMLVLRPNFGDQWDVVHLVTQTGTRDVIATRLPLGYAQGVAEDRAREMGAQVLVDRDAWWRNQEPSPKQLHALRRLGVPIRGIKTKGAASDAISAAIAAEVA